MIKSKLLLDLASQLVKEKDSQQKENTDKDKAGDSQVFFFVVLTIILLLLGCFIHEFNESTVNKDSSRRSTARPRGGEGGPLIQDLGFYCSWPGGVASRAGRKEPT